MAIWVDQVNNIGQAGMKFLELLEVPWPFLWHIHQIGRWQASGTVTVTIAAVVASSFWDPGGGFADVSDRFSSMVFSDMVLTPMDSNSLNSFWWIYKVAYFIHLRIKLLISLCHMGDVNQMLMFTCLPIVQSFPASSKWSKILVIKWRLLEKNIV